MRQLAKSQDAMFGKHISMKMKASVLHLKYLNNSFSQFTKILCSAWNKDSNALLHTVLKLKDLKCFPGYNWTNNDTDNQNSWLFNFSYKHT
jgi:hypothetical protein